MLGVELLGNVGLLVHGERKKKNKEREDKGQRGLFTMFPSLSPSSLIIMRPPKRKWRERERGIAAESLLTLFP